MLLHEKSLEANITHELLNLADSWYWFLTDIPLWRYWRPRYRLPFLKHPKAIATGFHITTEGKNDPTGEAGGGYDIRIKHGIGKHLLFIQYKKGDLEPNSPDPKSIFATAPHEHFVFKINSTKTNQHFTLRALAAGAGSKKGNAVVYAFPLIADISELEKYAGGLIRRTKFISIADIDKQAIDEKKPFNRNQEHAFRVCRKNMNRCELNYFFFAYLGPDIMKNIIADTIALGFQKSLGYYSNEITKNYTRYKLNIQYLGEGMQRAFGQYLRYLLHYFEVSPNNINSQHTSLYADYIKSYDTAFEFGEYKSDVRDIETIEAILTALEPFKRYIDNPIIETSNSEYYLNIDIPQYSSSYYIPITDNGLTITIGDENDKSALNDLSYLLI